MATPTTSLELSRQFTSFSGTDIKVLINGAVIGTIQALSYAVQREKGPVYVMGRVDPLSFSRGKRGIAGTMITLMLDRHPLFNAPFNTLQAVLDNDELYPTTDNLQQVSNTADLVELGNVNFSSADIGSNFTVRAPLFYFDQLPPMDVVVVGANEYGNAATMRIYGAEFLNEGSGYSVDDMVIENQMTYIARTILPWQVLGYWDFTTGLYVPGERPAPV